MCEELAWGCTGISTTITINNLAAIPIIIAGSEEQKKEWLGRMTGGELGSYAVTEPAAGSDVAGMLSTATKKGNEYVIKGSKTFISNASYSSFFVVFAYTDKAARHKGMSAFIVERNRPGFSVSKKFDKLGQRASDTAEITLDEVVIPRCNRLGQEGEGFKIAMKVFDRSRPTVAASAVGLAQRASGRERQVRQRAHDDGRAHFPASGRRLHTGRHGHERGGRAPAGAIRRRGWSITASRMPSSPPLPKRSRPTWR